MDNFFLESEFKCFLDYMKFSKNCILFYESDSNSNFTDLDSFVPEYSFYDNCKIYLFIEYEEEIYVYSRESKSLNNEDIIKKINFFLQLFKINDSLRIEDILIFLDTFNHFFREYNEDLADFNIFEHKFNDWLQIICKFKKQLNIKSMGAFIPADISSLLEYKNIPFSIDHFELNKISALPYYSDRTLRIQIYGSNKTYYDDEICYFDYFDILSNSKIRNLLKKGNYLNHSVKNIVKFYGNIDILHSRQNDLLFLTINELYFEMVQQQQIHIFLNLIHKINPISEKSQNKSIKDLVEYLVKENAKKAKEGYISNLEKNNRNKSFKTINDFLFNKKINLLHIYNDKIDNRTDILSKLKNLEEFATCIDEINLLRDLLTIQHKKFYNKKAYKKITENEKDEDYKELILGLLKIIFENYTIENGNLLSSKDLKYSKVQISYDNLKNLKNLQKIKWYKLEKFPSFIEGINLLRELLIIHKKLYNKKEYKKIIKNKDFKELIISCLKIFENYTIENGNLLSSGENLKYSKKIQNEVYNCLKNLQNVKWYKSDILFSESFYEHNKNKFCKEKIVRNDPARVFDYLDFNYIRKAKIQTSP